MRVQIQRRNFKQEGAEEEGEGDLGEEEEGAGKGIKNRISSQGVRKNIYHMAESVNSCADE